MITAYFLIERSSGTTFSKSIAKKHSMVKTKQKYLNSLKHFFEFVMVEKVDFPGISSSDLMGMLKTIESWSKSLYPKAEEEQMERQMEEFESLLSSAHMERIRSSNDHKRAESLLSPSNGLPSYTSSDFTLLRDFLTFELDLVSCQRSGALANCTVEEV